MNLGSMHAEYKCFLVLKGVFVAIWRPQVVFGVILPAQPQKFDVPLTARRTPELHAKRTLKVGNFTV